MVRLDKSLLGSKPLVVLKKISTVPTSFNKYKEKAALQKM